MFLRCYKNSGKNCQKQSEGVRIC